MSSGSDRPDTPDTPDTPETFDAPSTSDPAAPATGLRRRHLLLAPATLLAAKAFAVDHPAPAQPPIELEETSASALAQALAEGRTTAEDLVAGYSARIEAIDRRGPRLNSIIEMNPDALAIARVRDAGAVILGKTNMSEWANIRSTRSTSGWSGRGGLTRNPYALDRSTSGSSAGTGAALAASLAALGVGTETDGSIVSPASINGLVGLKPTIGRISRDGVIPISHTQDTAGPMTRTVADAALLYAAMAGPDAADPVTTRAPADAVSAAAANGQPLQGARLGVARAYFTGFDEADAVIEQAIATLRAQGAVVIDDIGLPKDDYGDAELSVLLYEFKHDLGVWLKTFAPQAPVQSLADLIAFNTAHRDREMPYFAQELFEKAQALGGLDTPAYREALAKCGTAAREQGLDKVIEQFRLDAVIAPTGGPTWLIDYVNGDRYGASFSTPAAVAGYPHLTVPAGCVRGLPLGLSFVGPAFSEARLLALGAAFEQATRHRRAPQYIARSGPP